MKPAAAALVAGLPRGANPTADRSGWQRPQAVEPQLVIDALTTLSRIDPVSADAAVGIFLGRPAIYDMDEVLIRAGLALWQSTVA